MLRQEGRGDVVEPGERPATSRVRRPSHGSCRDGEEDYMSDGSNRPSYIFIGLAGETNLDLPIHSGFYRMADGANEWEALKRGLPEKPEIRALAVHPHKQEI